MGRYFANHSEFEAWAPNWCYRCARDAFNSCPILTKAFCFPDEVIPEWLEQDTVHGYRLGDNVHCIDFKPKGYRVKFLNAAYPEAEHWVEDEDGRRVEVEEAEHG